MKCSICKKTGHNKTTCYLKNPLINPYDAEDPEILSGEKNPLGYLKQYMTESYNCYSLWCDKYVLCKKEDLCLEIFLIVESTTHCGYCSDNDGTVTTNNDDDIIYIKIPNCFNETFFEGKYLINCYQTSALFQEFGDCRCYCCKNYNLHKVESIKKI
jgi:hypothetical protein